MRLPLITAVLCVLVSVSPAAASVITLDFENWFPERIESNSVDISGYAQDGFEIHGHHGHLIRSGSFNSPSDFAMFDNPYGWDLSMTDGGVFDALGFDIITSNQSDVILLAIYANGLTHIARQRIDGTDSFGFRIEPGGEASHMELGSEFQNLVKLFVVHQTIGTTISVDNIRVATVPESTTLLLSLLGTTVLSFYSKAFRKLHHNVATC